MKFDPRDVLTVAQFAVRVGVSRIAVYGALARKELASIEVGGRLMLHVDDVEPFRKRLARKRAKADDRLPAA